MPSYYSSVHFFNHKSTGSICSNLPKYVHNREWDRDARCTPPPNPPFWQSINIPHLLVLSWKKEKSSMIYFLQEVSSVPPWPFSSGIFILCPFFLNKCASKRLINIGCCKTRSFSYYSSVKSYNCLYNQQVIWSDLNTMLFSLAE